MKSQPGMSTSSTKQDSSINGWYKATIFRRWIAVIIDYFVLLFVFVLLALLTLQNKPEGNFLYTLVGWAYDVFFLWKFGATLGKKLLKIQVVNKDYQPLSFWQALLRETIGKMLSGLVFGLGFLWAIWDKDRQTWHDKIAKTYVVTRIPNDGKNSVGVFILIGSLLAVPIITILATVVLIAINPLEMAKRSRDATRLSDLASIEQGLNITGQEVSLNDSKLFCGGQQPPCEGKSSVDGKGWIKVDLSKVKNVGLIIPVDPTNNGENYYRYCSNGVEWELNTTLESLQQQNKAESDSGDNPKVYEVGSNLTLCE